MGTVYRRFPDKEQLIDALFEARIEEIADVARAAAEHPDPWEGLVTFLMRAQELQSRDRGLKELVLGGARGAERARRRPLADRAARRPDPRARQGRGRRPRATSSSPTSR